VAGCTSARTAVFVTLTGKPSVSGATVCSGSSAVLSASGGSSYTWYDAPGGGIIGSGPTYTTPVLTATTTYYVVVISNNGCTSAFTPVTAKIAPCAPGAYCCRCIRLPQAHQQICMLMHPQVCLTGTTFLSAVYL